MAIKRHIHCYYSVKIMCGGKKWYARYDIKKLTTGLKQKWWHIS